MKNFTDLVRADGTPKIAPVQGYPGGIPWAIHLEAYAVYCKRYGKQDALIDLEGRGCRGGFGTGELDMFIPGWRDRVSQFGRMRAMLLSLADAVEALDGTSVENEKIVDDYRALVAELEKNHDAN